MHISEFVLLSRRQKESVLFRRIHRHIAHVHLRLALIHPSDPHFDLTLAKCKWMSRSILKLMRSVPRLLRKRDWLRLRAMYRDILERQGLAA